MIPEKEYSVWAAGGIGSQKKPKSTLGDYALNNQKLENSVAVFVQVEKLLAIELARQHCAAISLAECLGPFTEEDAIRKYLSDKMFFDNEANRIAKQIKSIFAKPF